MVNRLQNLPGAGEEATKYTNYYEVEALCDSYIGGLATALVIERCLAMPGDPGWIEFRDNPFGRGTEVRVFISYDPPAGPVGKVVAKVLQREPRDPTP